MQHKVFKRNENTQAILELMIQILTPTIVRPIEIAPKNLQSLRYFWTWRAVEMLEKLSTSLMIQRRKTGFKLKTFLGNGLFDLS